MRSLLTVFIVFFTQSCSSYCVPYGYLDFKMNQGAVSVGSIRQSDVYGLDGATPFPGGYEISKDNYLISVSALKDRGYPTISIQMELDGNSLGLGVTGGDGCLRVIDSAWDEQVEVMWVTDEKHCKNAYTLMLHSNDDNTESSVVHSLNVDLRPNGKKCLLDGL